MPAIFYSSHFIRAMKKIDPSLKEVVAEREKIFRKDPFDPRLRTHKLTGSLASLYSFSITYKYRILFKMRTDKTIVFLNVGDHSIYD
jgi:addiction module RelE/StbE family toxin